MTAIKLANLINNVALAILPTADEFARNMVARGHDVAIQTIGCGFADVAYVVSLVVSKIAK